jgi:hypothetical protein
LYSDREHLYQKNSGLSRNCTVSLQG